MLADTYFDEIETSRYVSQIERLLEKFGGSLAFQIVGYDCNSGVLQYQMTGGDGSPINLVLPGIFAGTVNANNLATHTFPSDARQGRSVSGYANQSGNQIAINFTTSCNQSPTTPQLPPTTPPPPPSSGCNFSEGQFLFSFYNEQIYAHYHNGVLFAAYQDASQGFKPQHWLIAAGFDPSRTNCFAQSDPRSGTVNPPSSCGAGTGLLGIYVNSTDPSVRPTVARTDGNINFSWADASPAPGFINADNFSVRWSGKIEAPATGTYTFKTYNDDGMRLWINDQLLIGDWNGHEPTWQQGNITLYAGEKYNIKLEFVDFGGFAQAQLYWSYPGQTLEIVPSCRLYSSNSISSRDELKKECIVRGYECIDYVVNCDTKQIVDIVFYDCNSGGTSGGGTTSPPITNPPSQNPGTENPGNGTNPETGSGNPTNPGTSPIFPNQLIPTTADFEQIDCQKIAGWAFANAGGHAYLDIYVTNIYGQFNKVATIKANQESRPNIRTYFNNPNIPIDCGFVWEIPDQLKTGRPLSVKVMPINNPNPIGTRTTSGDCSKPTTGNPWEGYPNFPHIGNPSALDVINFISEMQQRGIHFTDEEKAVITAFRPLINIIRSEVYSTGQKPDFIAVLDKFLQDHYNFVTSSRERPILANRSVPEQIAFRVNAINATLESMARFGVANPFACQDNDCNAYRHAFFNALNAQTFTVPVARQLGQAREYYKMIDPNTFQPINFVCDGTDDDIKAQYMDLYNNEWGYRAFTQFQAQGGNLSAIVKGMANNGSLRNAPSCP